MFLTNEWPLLSCSKRTQLDWKLEGLEQKEEKNEGEGEGRASDDDSEDGENKNWLFFDRIMACRIRHGVP